LTIARAPLARVVVRLRSLCSTARLSGVAARLQIRTRVEAQMQTTIDRGALAEHVLRTLACDHLEGRRSDLDTLTNTVRVRRADVRGVLSALHREGYVDVLRMKLTLEGFALGCALMDRRVPEVRRSSRKSIAA